MKILLTIYILAAILMLFIWFGLSYYFFFEGRSDTFQRMGSFGVFTFLMMFGLQHVSIEKREADRIKKLERKVQKAKDMELIHGQISEFRASQIEWYQESEKYTWRQRYLTAAFEIVFIGVSTLQWGFGDLLVIAFHGSK